MTRTSLLAPLVVVVWTVAGASADRANSARADTRSVARQQATFSARTEAVRVDVLVTANGVPVRGLTASDFEVFDNGVRQSVDLMAADPLPLNIVLAFDVSESVAGTRLGQLRSASEVLLDELRKGDSVAVATFSHRVTLQAPLATDLDAVRRVLADMKAGGDTGLFDGTYFSLMLGESDVGRGLMIVFSDGIDTSSWLPADAVVGAARRSGLVVYAVSAAASARLLPFLKDVCDATGGRVMEVETTWNLSSAFLDILEEFRQRYLVSYSAPRGAPGWHRLEVRVKGRKGVTVKARPGYFAN